MHSCMSPQFAIQEQPEQPLSRVTLGGHAARFFKTQDKGVSETLSIDTSDIVKDQAAQIASLQQDLLRERSLIIQYRDEWDSVRQTLQAARRQNEMLVKERDAYQKQTHQLQQKLSTIETKYEQSKRENDALSFVSRNVTSEHFASLPALQASLKEVVNKVGSYVLERELRKGESGNILTVYRKSDKDAQFAMKVVNKSATHDWATLRQLDREVGVLKKIQHSNIIQLHDVLHGYRAFYLILEHADMSLRDYQARFAPEQASCGWIKAAITGVTRALEHLHAAKAAHLDIRPENILLVGVGQSNDSSIPLLLPEQVRLSGFGSSAFQQDLTAMHKIGHRSGSLGYFAPDVTLSRSSINGSACDMWSLGATLLDMTVGFCDGWMPSYEQHAVNVVAFEEGIGECLKELKDKGLSWYKDADLKDLLVERLLVLPAMRATAQQVLRHKWLGSRKTDMMWV